MAQIAEYQSLRTDFGIAWTKMATQKILFWTTDKPDL